MTLLNELRALRGKVTPGPWHVEPVTDGDDHHIYDEDIPGHVWCVCHPQTECDATTVVPWLPEHDARLIALCGSHLNTIIAALEAREAGND